MNATCTHTHTHTFSTYVVRVRHIKGLLDVPICYIEDNTEQRYLMSAPSGQDLGPGYYPPGSTRFSARGDLPPAVGVGESEPSICNLNYSESFK